MPSALVHRLMYSLIRCVSVGFDIVMRLLGPALVCLACGLVTWIVRNFFIYIMPAITPTFSLVWWLHFVVGMWIVFNILFNYISCIFTSPGQPVAADEDSVAESQMLAAENSDPREGGDFSKWCKKCRAPKPARCHHCHICKKCVLAMDHHCPWMANCVGYGNYRYFILFLFYVWSGCIFSVLATAPLFLKSFRVNTSPLPALTRNSVVFTFVLTLSVGIAVSILFAWHIYLVFSGQTTIEFYHNHAQKKRAKKLHGQVWVNQYDLGRWRNFENIFGKQKFPLQWALPSRRAPPGDGVHWPTISRMNVYNNQSHIV